MTERLIRRYDKQIAVEIGKVLALEKGMKKGVYESYYSRDFDNHLGRIDDLLAKREKLRNIKGKKAIVEKVRTINSLKKHLQKKQESRHSNHRTADIKRLAERVKTLKKELKK